MIANKKGLTVRICRKQCYLWGEGEEGGRDGIYSFKFISYLVFRFFSLTGFDLSLFFPYLYMFKHMIVLKLIVLVSIELLIILDPSWP